MNLERMPLTLVLALLCSAACTNETRKNDAVTQGEAGARGLGSVDELPGNSLTVDVRDDELVYVDLSVPEVVHPEAPDDSTGWDLALQGWDVFTNSGPSGPGSGGSFGPADELAFLSGAAPDVPFLREDTTGGAFLEWYAYDGTTHSLYSRFHVYGVRSRDKLYKLQVLGYYGEQLGAPVSALYSLRYVRVTASGSHELVTIESLDATAGGPNIGDDQPSGCLVLATAAVEQLTPAEARTSDAWDLCFRRDIISVNGELGGPGNVTAVDLHGEDGAREELEQVTELTAESELGRFESVDYSRLTEDALSYRGDRIVSGFEQQWFRGRGRAAEPAPATWLVRAADGKQLYLVVFTAIDGSETSAGRVSLQVRAVASR